MDYDCNDLTSPLPAVLETLAGQAPSLSEAPWKYAVNMTPVTGCRSPGAGSLHAAGRMQRYCQRRPLNTRDLRAAGALTSPTLSPWAERSEPSVVSASATRVFGPVMQGAPAPAAA